MAHTPFQAAGLQLLAFFAAARLLETATSWLRTPARRPAPPRDPWFAPFVVLHAAILAGSAASLLGRARPPPAPLAYAALGALLVAVALRAWVFVSLGRRWNVRVVDPGEIVTTGPYRFVRHPSDLAVIVEVAALPLALGAWELAILGTIANALVLSQRIPFEERVLSEAHPSYRDIMMRRPRFLPRLFRRAPTRRAA